MKNILFLLGILTIACSSKKGVFYDEMYKVLVVSYENNKLILHTGNSKDHSAFLICEIKTSVDKVKKELHITGFQAIGEEHKDRFEIDLKSLGIENIQEYQIIWVDPDQKQINLQLQKNK
jgi:hypothetical protein